MPWRFNTYVSVPWGVQFGHFLCHMRTKATKHKEKMEDYSWAEPSAESPLFPHRHFKVGMQNCYNIIKIKTKNSLERACKTKKFNWWSQCHLPSFQYNTQAEGGRTKFESYFTSWQAALKSRRYNGIKRSYEFL